MTAPEIVWAEPPPKAQFNRQGPLPIWAALREHPGEWAVYREAATGASMVTHIRQGRVVGVAAGEIEAVSRKREDGKYDIYVRYVGRPTEASA